MELYKFREVNANNLSALSNKQLWFSSLNDFNDPFEGAHILEKHVPQEILEGINLNPKESMSEAKYDEMLNKFGLTKVCFTSRELFEKVVEHDLNLLLNIIQASKVVCFSLHELSNDPIKSNLMWSHYANGLRGFCLIFDGELLQDEIAESTNKAMRPIKVDYKDIPNTLKLLDFINSESILGSEKNDFIQTVTETIATKSSEWSYENELRIISLEKNSFHTYSGQVLKSIVIGGKMSSEHRKLLLDIVKSNHPNILIQEARLKPNSYSLEIVPYIE